MGHRFVPRTFVLWGVTSRSLTSWFSFSLSLSVTLIEPALQRGQSGTVAGVASSRLSRLAKRQLGGVRSVCPARRNVSTRRCVPGYVAVRGFASNRVRLAQQQQCAACQCHRGARRAVHTPRQGLRECRSHKATRGAAANAAVVCRCSRTVCPLVFKQLVGRQFHA